VDPILYKFNSSFQYYPLVITSPVPGETRITLFILTRGRVNKDYYPMQKTFYRLSGGVVRPIEFVLSKGELSRIDLRIGELFVDMAWLTVLKYDGRLSWITRDLMIAEGILDSATTTDVGVEVIMLPALAALFILIGAACTLAGVICTVLMTRLRKESAKTG